MNPAKVVMHEIQRNHVAVVLQFLAESVCEPGEAPHRHAHREILALHVGCADVLGIGIADDRLHLAANASSGAVSRFRLARRAVNLMQLRIIHVCTKSIFHGL